MTRDLKTQLEIGADVTGAVTGIASVKKSLDTLGPAAAKAGQDASSGLDGVGKGAGEGAAKIDAATRNIQASIQRQIAITEAGTRSGAEYYRVLANQRGANLDALKPYLDQLDAVTQKQRAAGAALAGTTAPLERVGVSAAQTAAALRGVPAQFTDIVTSLAAGQQPLTVFLQQGGQLKDTFGGAGPAAQALAGYVRGLINPFSLAAVAAGVLGFAYFKGSQEADAYSKALILSGNAAGTTVGQLNEMARAIGSVTGTQAAAADALAQLAATGQVGAANLQQFAQATVQFERAAGVAIKDTVKDFSELGKAPLEATIKLNESMRFLTVSTYEQIKALQNAGKENEAAAAAQKAYADAIESRSGQIVERLGSIERAWLAIKKATAEAIDAALGIGRQQTLQDQLADTNQKIAKAESKPFDPSVFGGNAELRAQLPLLKARRDTILESLRLADRAAQLQGEETRSVEARIKFDKEGEKYLTDKVKMEREIAAARAQGAAARASEAEIEGRVAAIRAKYVDKGAVRDASAIAKARLGLDIEGIRAANAAVIESYTTSERILDSVRAAGLLSDREYYESKRAFIALDAQAKEDAARAEITRLQREKLTGKDALENQKKVAEAQARINKARVDAAAQTEVLDNQELGRLNQIALSYQQAQAAAEAYLQTLRNQNDRAVASVGRGDVARDRNAGINQIEDRYAQQRLQLESDLRNGAFKGREADYQRDLDLINDYEAKATAAFVEGFDRRLEAQRDWANGARRATENYLTDQQDAAKQTEQLFSRSFAGAEDALVQFVRTGKLSFKSFADSIITELIRIQVRAKIAESVGGSGLFGSLFAGLGWLLGGGIAFDSGGIGITSGGNSLVGLGLGGGRAYGGGVNPYGINPVAELGEPEVLRTRRGTYLINGNEPGVVEPLNKAAAGASAGAKAPTWTIVNTGTPQKVVGQQEIAPGQMALITADAADAAAQRINADVNNPNSKFSRSLEARFQLQRKRA